MFKPLFIFLSLATLWFTTMAQSKKIDSLVALLPQSTDTAKVNLLNLISSSYWYRDPKQTINYADQAVALASSLQFKKGLATAYNSKAVGYYQQNNYDQALLWYNKAYTAHQQLNNYRGEAFVLSNMGMTYWKQGKLDTAVQFYLKSMKIWEEHKSEKEIASLLQNIANVYSDQEDYERALSYYFRALDIERKHKASNQEISMTLSNIGTAYLSEQKYEQALKYFLQSMDYLGPDDLESRAVSLSNAGLTYVAMKQFDKALPYLTDALALQDSTGDKDALVHTVLGLAEIHLEQGQLDKAEYFGKRGLETAIAVDEKGRQADAWQMLAAIAEKKGDYNKAYQYSNKYMNLHDSMRARENIFNIAHLEATYRTEKKLELMKKENEQQAFRRNAMAAGLFGLLVIAALVVSRQRLKIRQNKELVQINETLKAQSRKLEEQTIKLKELDKTKSTFFANISHEFRTPLTLILNSLTDKISAAKAAGNVSELPQLDVMYRNARRLLNLINQLLDLSKLDAGKMKLSLVDCNLSQTLQLIYASFTSLGESRNVTFSISLPIEPIICRLDQDKIEKIVYNLLSNAFKFTPSGGLITLTANLDEQSKNPLPLRIRVSDTGPGIAAEDLSQVFNRFYQGNQHYSDEQGTGIGLALTRELVELHNGRIDAESTKGSGTSFVVSLPFVVAQEAELTPDSDFTAGFTYIVSPVEATTELPSQSAKSQLAASEDQPTILVVEDNDDLRNYIRQQLATSYAVLETSNGRQGLEKAFTTIPDLIISDWMMPEMDGITLCHHLKSDERTSHIPVILLTALAGDDTKLQGLETGADDYLTKPFDNRELLARVRNLIESRRQLRDRFARELTLGPKKIKVSSMDEKFLEKVMEAVETYMGDPEFNMEKFGQQVGLSRMQLHRKLKALTGESPGDFLRSMRLKRARRLLESRSGNVSEVAYEVGFNNLSYFSRCYKEEFGISPTETSVSKTT